MTPADERQHLQLLGLAGFASMASMRICDTMLVVLGQEFHVSTGDASAVVSVFAVVYGILQLFYGPLGERFGKLRVVSLAVSACAIISAITAMSMSLPMLVIMRGFMGAAAAGIIPLSMAWVGDQVPYERRQETLAKLMSATVLGMMSGLWFGGFAADTVGWRGAFVLLSVMFGLAAVLLLRRLRRQSKTVSLAAPGLWAAFRLTGQLLSTTRVRLVMSVTATEGALVFGAMAFMPTHLHQQYGLSVVAAGSVMMLYGLGGLLYSQMARRWLAWLGERGLVRTGALLVAVGLLVLAWGSGVWLGMLACLMTGLGFYMLHNTLQVQATQMAPAARGTAVTLFACSLFFGQSTGVLLVAQSVDLGWLAYAFTGVAVGVVMLGAVIYRLVGRH
ncbi:MFS transporter [Limnohabitans sp. 2KL-51]|jgi:predicted MFS family arabinose efflux permease|uniref:MFS transporter n=1 Tax=Limnohabitans sp. 2KL-51 TaxID=1977911 RepID=UPI000D3C4DA8|nr:MFS transporter [Limnohabitans sp. 2KL-51]PUE51379.1 MFS transporter [Limnohabitans sp. 2KL-51]